LLLRGSRAVLAPGLTAAAATFGAALRHRPLLAATLLRQALLLAAAP
jgi:hypothetical protein